MKSILFLGLMVFGFSTAQANVLSGTFVGTGKWIMKNTFPPIKQEENCTSIEINFSEKINETDKSTELTMDRYDAKCKNMGSDWGPLKFIVKNGLVFNDGDEVGTFDGEIFKTLMPDGSVQYAFNFRIIKENGHVVKLNSYYGVKNMMGATVIEGELFKK